eukprot:11214127-Lingulodinium_polyedra.AAC.1
MMSSITFVCPKPWNKCLAKREKASRMPALLAGVEWRASSASSSISVVAKGEIANTLLKKGSDLVMAWALVWSAWSFSSNAQAFSRSSGSGLPNNGSNPGQPSECQAMALRRCNNSWVTRVQACLARWFCWRSTGGLLLRACGVGKELEAVRRPMLSKLPGSTRRDRVCTTNSL